ncbi:MAG: hypothetical protein ACI89J_002835 [Hyphomicrobiaceae bacterium]|jgi:hypothetical protein
MSVMDHINNLFGAKTEARIRYADADYHIMSPGEFVRCAVTGQQIAIADLRYWSVARQEAYVDARASLARHLECLAEADAGDV